MAERPVVRECHFGGYYLRGQARWQDAQNAVESLLAEYPELDQYQQLLVELKAKTKP